MGRKVAGVSCSSGNNEVTKSHPEGDNDIEFQWADFNNEWQQLK